MDRNIRTLLGQRDLQLFDEQSFAADVGERPIEDAIALRRHLHDFNLQCRMRRPQERGDVVRLPEGEFALTSGDTQWRHDSRDIDIRYDKLLRRASIADLMS